MKNKKNVQTYCLPFLFMMLFILFNSCNKGIISTSHWQENALKIDGSSNDWNDSLLYDAKSHLLYTVSNDNKNLYICIKVADLKNQMKLLRRGFTIWLDTVGKDRKSFGIKFPLSGVVNYYKMPSENNGNNGDLMKDMKTMKKMLISEQREFELIGFTLLGYEKNESIKASLFASAGIKIALGIDSLDYMIYEMLVPLNYIYKSPSVALNDSKGILSIGMESGNTNSSGGSHDDEGSGNGMHSGNGGGGRSGMGGMGGGGMRGGGGGMHSGGHQGGSNGSGSQSRDTEPIKTWIKVKLVKQKN